MKNEKRKAKNEKRKSKSENEKRKTKNEKRKAKNEKRKTKIKLTSPCSFSNVFLRSSSLFVFSLDNGIRKMGVGLTRGLIRKLLQYQMHCAVSEKLR